MLRRTFSLLPFFAVALVAAHAAAPSVEIRDARAPATPPGSKVAAVYFEVVAAEPDALLGARTPVAERAEIHETVEADGTMRMRRVEAAQVTPDKPLMLAPGAMHLMLLELERPLQAHATFPLTLHFAKAGEVLVEVHVVAPGGAHSHH